MILDGETLALAPGVEGLVKWAEGRSLPGVLKMELLASMVELATEICESPAEALRALIELRGCRGGERAGPDDRGGRDTRVQPPDRAADRA